MVVGELLIYIGLIYLVYWIDTDKELKSRLKKWINGCIGRKKD
jgi:hypothetical protein